MHFQMVIGGAFLLFLMLVPAVAFFQYFSTVRLRGWLISCCLLTIPIGNWGGCRFLFPVNTAQAEQAYDLEHDRLIREVEYYVKDRRVLDAMRQVPRHEFIPEEIRAFAYLNQALPIGHNQTISQPLVVGVMTEAMELKQEDKVLEVGTGSGYQAAVLSKLASEVYSVEIIEALAQSSKETLRRLGYGNVHVKAGDGYLGWKEAAPFSAIMITAAAPLVPEPLVDQLVEGGRLVVPLGREVQEVEVFRKKDGKLTSRSVLPVRFVPMTGTIEGR